MGSLMMHLFNTNPDAGWLCIKSEYRKPKSETNPKCRIQIPKPISPGVLDIWILKFEFVSDFGFRISGFRFSVLGFGFCFFRLQSSPPAESDTSVSIARRAASPALVPRVCIWPAVSR
jgi:hypothetical protein